MQRKFFSGAIFATLALFLALGLGAPAFAAPPLLPPRPEPVVIEPPDRDPPISNTSGAYIELRVQFGQSKNVWTVVQRQAGNPGSWRDVADWTGTLDTVANNAGGKTWFVDPSRFGMGPLRWLVYDSPGGKVLAESAAFFAPTQSNQTVIVGATVP